MVAMVVAEESKVGVSIGDDKRSSEDLIAYKEKKQ